MHVAGLVSPRARAQLSFSGTSTQRARSPVPTARSTTIIIATTPEERESAVLQSLQASSLLPSPYEYWVFSRAPLPGCRGPPEELWERARTEHCMPFYCTCPGMVQYQLVFCCKCLPVVLKIGLSLSYQDPTSMFTQ